MGAAWTLCSQSGAVTGTEPPHSAGHEREHLAGCARTMHPAARLSDQRIPRGLSVTLMFKWGGASPSHSSCSWEQGRGQSPARNLGGKHTTHTHNRNRQLALPPLAPPVWAADSGLGPSFPSFLGMFCTKTGADMSGAYFHACLCYACVPSSGTGATLTRSLVSLLGPGQRRGSSGDPILSIFQGECFHLPNPAPMICPQRGTKGLLRILC